MGVKNVILEKVPVTDYAAEGKALARLDGKVIFVKGGAVPGDVVDLRLTRNKKDWAEGTAVHFHSYGADRVDPFCSHFGLCGGCQWQMLPYTRQLEYKQRQVEEHLRHIGRLDIPALEPIRGAAKTRGYRNKLEFTFSNRAFLPEKPLPGEPPRPALGFHIPKLFDKILDIHTCHLQEEPSNIIRNTVRDFAIRRGYPFYDHRAQQGWLRNLIIRLSLTGEVMVNLCLHHEDREAREALLDHLWETVPGLSTLLYTINPKRNDSMDGLECQVYRGPGYIREQLGAFRFKIGPKSFFQTNTAQAELLYGIVRDFAGLTGTETVYDLYCGTGTIGIFLSRQAGRVVGVELVAEAVADAEENARLNGVENASFHAGDVLRVCDEAFFARHGHPDLVITDPPRAGMHADLVTKLLDVAAPRIVYVSCNPATQARDLLALDPLYRITRIQPVDMFPHTHHIENVVLLEKRNALRSQDHT